MPHPSHRLDLVLAPADPDRPMGGGVAAALLAELVAEGALTADGAAGPRASELVEGGFARGRVEADDRLRLYANQQGGFRVRCPATGASVVPAFQAALRAWRAGGARALRCPACGDVHPLEALDLAPAGAFARVALVLSDVASTRLGDLARVEAHLGPVRVVWRRPG